MLGDQFSLLALPWLVLSLTGDSLSLGIAVALMGTPRAVLILLGWRSPTAIRPGACCC
jgi:hypothetical protein